MPTNAFYGLGGTYERGLGRCARSTHDQEPSVSTASTIARNVLTAPLRSELARAIPSRPFHVRFWDGSVVPATTTPAPEFHVHSPAAVAHFLRAPSELGL